MPAHGCFDCCESVLLSPRAHAVKGGGLNTEAGLHFPSHGNYYGPRITNLASQKEKIKW